jgi:hypothetical protein
LIVGQSSFDVSIVAEHGKAAKKETTREEFVLCRDRHARLVVSDRRRLA